MGSASVLVTTGFVILPLLVAFGFVLACDWAGRRLGESDVVRLRRAARVSIVTAVWLLTTVLAAASGILRRFDVTPPPFAALLVGVLVVGIALPCSSLGTLLVRGLPLWALVGSQVYRLPLELLMHRAYLEGVMPVQMSYAGRNWDILTGITAGLLGAWLACRPVPLLIVRAWNVLGLRD